MAVATATRQKPVRKASLIKRTVGRSIGILFISQLCLIVWFLCAWFYHGFDATYQTIQGISKQQAMAVVEFNNGAFTRWAIEKISPSLMAKSALVGRAAQGATTSITHVAKEQLHGVLQEEQDLINEQMLAELCSDLFLKAQQFWLLLCATAHLLLIKASIIVAAIPLFVLAIAAGLVDGLNQRAIRTASLGRESTYVFHKSIPVVRRALFWVLVLWLAIPHALSPTPVFVSLSLFIAVLVSVTSSRFKKYL